MKSIVIWKENGLDLITADTDYRMHAYLYDYRYVPEYYIDTICLNEVFMQVIRDFELVRSDLSYPIFSDITGRRMPPHRVRGLLPIRPIYETGSNVIII